jgi:succinate dehydrogenase / fumarate reductase, cytochrome b subunit
MALIPPDSVIGRRTGDVSTSDVFHDEQEPAMNAQRPLSPHLQVYRPQLTSMLSIFHRITGLVLCLGAVAVVWWLLALSSGPESYAVFYDCAHARLGLLFAAAMVFSLLFHLANGVRHLFWDAGKGFDLATTYASGWAVLAFALFGSVATWFYLGGQS